MSNYRGWVLALVLALCACFPQTNPVGCGRHRFIVDTTTAVEAPELHAAAERILHINKVGYGLSVPADPGEQPLEIDLPEDTSTRFLNQIEEALAELTFVTHIERPPLVACRFDPAVGPRR